MASRRVSKDAGIEGAFSGAAVRIRDRLWLDREPERQARHREEWPDLWSAIDGLVDVLDRMYPP